MLLSNAFIYVLSGAISTQAFLIPNMKNIRDQIVSPFHDMAVTSIRDRDYNIHARNAPPPPPPPPQPKKCPAIWSTVVTTLAPVFLNFTNTPNGCSDMARAAIRFAFHDAGTFSINLPTVAPASGGADGSLLINASEISRQENRGLQDYYNFLLNLWTTKFKSQGVGAADLIYFAASQALVTCPKGPPTKVLVGRTDTTVASPTGLMPAGFGTGSDYNTLFNLFQAKGFTATDLAALVGIHTVSKAFFETPNVPVGGPQDTTPGIADVDFYSQTYHPVNGMFRFASDINLSNTSTAVGQVFKQFVGNQGLWIKEFVPAFNKLTLLGIPTATSAKFIDCSSVIPKPS